MPLGHFFPLAFLEPAGQKNPAGLAQPVHDRAALPENRPAGQRDPVFTVAPAAHAEPDLAVHTPEHSAEVVPLEAPKRPEGHSGQEAEPPAENRPTGHTEAVADWEAAGHWYPGAHGPLWG